MKRLKLVLQKFGSLIILLVLMLCMGFVAPNYWTWVNLKNIGVQASVNVVLAVGMLIVIIIGGIDLSIGAILAFSGIVAAYIMKSGIQIQISLILSCFVGACLGLMNGLIVTQLKLPPFVATLGTTGVFRGAALLITGGLPVTQLPPAIRNIGQGTFLGIPNPIIMMSFVCLIFFFILSFTTYGRYIYALGSNYEATRLSGIKVKTYVALTYTVEGFLAAVAGVILLGRLAVAQPNAAQGYESNAIAAAVIGGASFSGGSGTVGGALIGALIMSVLNNGFTLLGLNAFFQQLAIGVVVILAVSIDISQRKRMANID